MGEAWLVEGSIAGLAGVGVLRASWSRRKRSSALNSFGWLLLLAGAASGWAAAGAWGVAMVSLPPMVGAMALLAVAALGSAPSKVRASSWRAGLMPEGSEPLRLGGRCLTFLLVAVLAAVAGLGIAVAAGWLALLVGGAKADAYAMSLFTMPIVWSAVAFALLMQPRRSGQFKVIALASILAWPCLALGLLA
jgi:hypothetical protein